MREVIADAHAPSTGRSSGGGPCRPTPTPTWGTQPSPSGSPGDEPLRTMPAVNPAHLSLVGTGNTSASASAAGTPGQVGCEDAGIAAGSEATSPWSPGSPP